MPEYYLCVPSKTDRGPLRCADLWLAGLPRTTVPQHGFNPGRLPLIAYSV